MRGDNKLWVIVENKRVTTGGRRADTQRCAEMLAAIRARRAANGEPLKELENQLYLIGLDGEEFVCACTQVVRGVVCRFAATGGSAWVKIVDSHHATVISQLQRVCA